MSIDNEEIQFLCSVCGKEFDPDPDTMVEFHLTPVRVRANDEIEALTLDDIRDLDSDDLQEIGLTEEARDAMLRGEETTVGGCICIACQDEALEEDQG